MYADIAAPSPWLNPLLVNASVLKTTKGIGSNNDITAIGYPRRNVSKDRRVMCSHRSTDMSVITSTVSDTKYVVQSNPIRDVVVFHSEYSKLGTEIKALAIPVHKSVNAKTVKRVWNVVLWKDLFQIAAKTTAFPTTATGEKQRWPCALPSEQNSLFGSLLLRYLSSEI